MPAPTSQISAALLEGVWMGISHQTITTTAMSADRTFCGTYFTPAMNLRATFAGEWELQGDELKLTYLESESPVFKCPMEDLNRLEVVSDEEVILHTLPKGISLRWERVEFPELGARVAKRVEPVEPPLITELRELTFEDLSDGNGLMDWIFYCIESSSEALWDDKMVDALKNRVPKKAGYYFATTQFEGLWGNGGMQHVLLNEQVEQNQFFLKTVAAGYRHFGNETVADLIRRLAVKTREWMAQITELNEHEAPDAEFEAIWNDVDGYDEIFEETLGEEDDIYDAILADIHKHPTDYME